MALEIGAVGYWECSAKENRGIDVIFEVAARQACKAVGAGLNSETDMSCWPCRLPCAEKPEAVVR